MAKSNMSKTARILRLFQQKGRLTQQELNRISYRYGGIIHELRKEGHNIVTVPVKPPSHYDYQYKPDEPEVLESYNMHYEDLPKTNLVTRFMKKILS